MPNPDTRARYVTGDNAPGFLPDVEPRGPWNSWADAVRDIARMIEDDADSRLDEVEPDAPDASDSEDYIRDALAEAKAELETLRTAERPDGADVVFMGRAFFIRPADPTSRAFLNLQTGALDDFELVAVEDLREGDSCDLQGDGYAQGEAFEIAAEFELFEVIGVERETADCVRVDFEGADSVGFPPGHVLRTRRAPDLDALEAEGWSVENSHGTEDPDGSRAFYYKDSDGGCSGDYPSESAALAGAWAELQRRRANPPRQPFTVIAAVQEGATRGRFWHVMLSSPAAFFERGDTPSEAPEAGAELQEAWEVLAILPGHITPAYLAD
jgi:hypothetical protein